MATISNTGQQTISRALACGWTHGNGHIGPGRFLKLSKSERKAFLRILRRRAQPNNAWVPVRIVREEEQA